MNTKMKTIGLFAIALVVLAASVGSAQANDMPDLNVSSITVNPGDTRAGEIIRLYVNESNGISAVVWNNGTADAGAFDVCFDADSAKIGCVEVTSLAAGASTPVNIDWTPSCADYSVMPGFPPQALPITINVTADCNCTDCPTCPPDGSNGKIAESDETNNTLLMHIPAIQVWNKTGWMAGLYAVMGGVVNNGYKSKELDCNTSEEPLTLFEYDGEIVGGGIAYNVSGVKGTLAGEATSTRVHHIDIPAGATVKKARLYLYWYDYWFHYFDYSKTGCMADLSVKFNGSTTDPTTVPLAAMYNDQKGFGAYANPKGTYAYDVTSLVSGSGDYTVEVYNNDRSNETTLLGEMLYVVYEGAPCGKTIQLWTLEGNDYLMQGNVTHPSSGGYRFGVTVEEATATVAFPGTIVDLTNKSATLVTVVAQGRTTGMDMLFNDNIVKTDAWDVGSEAYPASKICVESVDVTANLLSSGNNMGFRDTGTDGMQASNAFLIVELSPADVTIEPETLNLKNNGEWVTAYIELPGYDLEDIDLDTVLLDCTIHAENDTQYGFVTSNESYLMDHDGDGIQERMVKFNRTEVIEYLDTYDFDGDTGNHKLAELFVTGVFDGTAFEGSDTVRVLH